MPAPLSCSACGYVFEPGVAGNCPQCGRRQGLNWGPWMGVIQGLGVVGFLLVVGAPWEVTVIATAIVAANALLRRRVATGPATREKVAEQERNAARPTLQQVANLGVLLRGGLPLASFIGSFVMFM